MTTVNNGGPACPLLGDGSNAPCFNEGMTLRDWFAGQALAEFVASEKARRAEGVDGLEDTPAARAVMGAFWEGSRLAFQRFAPCGTPWKDYDHFRESAWRDSDSRANILHPTSTVEEAISRSMGEHWAVLAKEAYMEGHNDHRCVGDAIDTAWSNSRTRKALEGGAQ